MGKQSWRGKIINRWPHKEETGLALPFTCLPEEHGEELKNQEHFYDFPHSSL
jgi:hypothetical protein